MTRASISYILLLWTISFQVHLIKGFATAALHSRSTWTSTSTSTPLQQSRNDQATDTKEQKLGTWNPLRLAVLKLKFTELKYTSPLNYEKRPGTYTCAACDSELFTSVGKYDSGSGWPSFWKTASKNRIVYKKEWDGRVEVQCANCRGHLGHVFPDGPMRMDLPKEELAKIPEDDLKTSTESNPYTRLPRYCVNGASLRFTEGK